LRLELVMALWRLRHFAWRVAQLALLLSLALAASLSGAAQATDSLYAVGKISVDATAKDAVAAKAIGMADAEKRAVMTVLQRLVPLSALAQLPELSQDDIEAMVEGVSVRSEQNSTTRYLAVLDVNVNEAGVKQLLDGQGVPYSEVRAPSVSILLLVIAGGSVKDQGPEGWWQAWEDLDLSHSIAPATILKPRPNLDVETVKAVLAGDAQALAAMQGAYGYGPFVIAVGDIADGTFVTRLVGADGVGAINYGHSDKLSSADAKAAARDAAATAFAIIENRWKETQIPATPATEVNYEEGKEAKPPGNAEVPRNVVAIVEFSGLKDWQDIRGKLMNVAGIQALEVNSLSARAASISFDYAGSLDRLQTVLNQSGVQLNERDGNFVLRSR
jgi:Uncharacterized protein conserved in bacteria (DUF2066)